MPWDTARDGWFLTGPTASGKTQVGVALARRIDAEIVSLDSMSLYRDMDIGTAKPSKAERGAVRHHLIDLLEPHEEFSLAQYVEAAEGCARQIAERGRQVLFVGGTPLYLKGLLRGLFEGPPADWDFRKRMAEEAGRQPPGWLHQRVAEVDPATAARLHPNDTRRLIRALEVYQQTGEPISRLQQEWGTARLAEQCRVFVLEWPREELYERINARVEAMFTAGLVAEVRRLLARAQGPGRTARQALGYREVIEHLQGNRDLPQAIELVKRNTRRLAKRQRTWFRGLSECRFVQLAGPIDPDEVARRIVDLARRA
jgi:tRNA dimethylallyltransferase